MELEHNYRESCPDEPHTRASATDCTGQKHQQQDQDTLPYVLVIDDDPAVVALLLTLLRDEEGFRTHSMFSVSQTLSQGPIVPPALILLDVSLPGERLPDMVAQLRTRRGWEGVPITLCSGQADLERLAKDVGAAASLRKPFNLDAVIALAERYAQAARDMV